MENQEPNGQPSFLGRAYNPFLQAAVAAGLMLLMHLLVGMLQISGMAGFSPRIAWVVSLAFLLLYAIFNSIFCLASRQSGVYWNRSILGYISLGVLGGLVAWALSGRTLSEAGSFQWLYLVVTFAYMVFISIVNFMRRIVEFAQNEDWKAPKIKSRKRGY